MSADFERLLAGVGLRDQQVVDIDAELAGIDRIERVFGVDEGADAALLLGFSDARAAPASSCRRIPARRSRPRGLSAGRRRRARYRAPMSPMKSTSISMERSFLPSRMTDPLPNWRSIWESAADRALVLSMEDPSTIRRAVADIGRAPYGGDSLAGQTGTGRFRIRLLLELAYHVCSSFAICSFWSGDAGPF